MNIVAHKLKWKTLPLDYKGESWYAVFSFKSPPKANIVKAGDRHHAVIEKEVIKTGIIKDNFLIKISTSDQLKEVENDPKFYPYWSKQNEKDKAFYNEKKIKFLKNTKKPLCIFLYSVVPTDDPPFVWDVFTGRNIFMVYNDTEEVRKELYQYRGISIEQCLLELSYKKDIKYYLGISHLCRKEMCDINKDPDKCDVDHIIPRSVGGPGIFKENLELTTREENSKKGDSVPVEFAVVAGDFDEFKNFTPTLDHRDEKTMSQYAEKVMGKVWLWELSKQKKLFEPIKDLYIQSRSDEH